MLKKYISVSLLSGSSFLFTSILSAHGENSDHSHEDEANVVENIPPVPVEITASVSELFETAGFIMGKRMGFDQMKMSETEINTLVGLIPTVIESSRPSDEVIGEFQNLQTLVPQRIEAVNAGSEEIEELTANQLEALAFIMVNQSALSALVNEPSEMDSFINGLKLSPTKEVTPEVESLVMQLQPFFEERMAIAQEKEEAAVAKENEAFIATLEANESISKTDAGLYYEVIEAGEGPVPSIDDTVVVHYHGTLTDGTVFDSSIDRGQPATFPMSGVIPGFSGGLSQIKEGGKVKIYIPSELGYGQTPPPGSPIKAGGFIIFDCELIEVQKAEQVEPAAQE